MPDFAYWLTPTVAGLGVLTACILVLWRFLKPALCRLLPPAACATGILALLLAPTVWSLIPVWHGGDAGLPFAGPELLTRPRQAGPPVADRRLLDYLLANWQGQRFLAATLNSNTAAPLILATGQPVMALGGFSGRDRILTPNQLAGRVRENQVRFFLLPQPGDQQADLILWVTRNCRSVPPERWQPSPPPVRPQLPAPGQAGDQQLWDCAPVTRP